MAANVGLFSALKGELTKSTKEYEARKEIKKQLYSVASSTTKPGQLISSFIYDVQGLNIKRVWEKVLSSEISDGGRSIWIDMATVIAQKQEQGGGIIKNHGISNKYNNNNLKIDFALGPGSSVNAIVKRFSKNYQRYYGNKRRQYHQLCNIPPPLVLPETHFSIHSAIRSANKTDDDNNKDDDIWFIKAPGVQRGEGIIVRKGNELEELLYDGNATRADNTSCRKKNHRYIKNNKQWEKLVVQRSVSHGNIACINGCKADLRMYILYAPDGKIYYFPNAIVRIANIEYRGNQNTSLESQLTNVSTGGNIIEGMEWDCFRKALPSIGPLLMKIVECSLDWFQYGRCELIGVDIMLDTDGNPFLLELNSSPQMGGYDTPYLFRINMLKQMLHLAVYPFIRAHYRKQKDDYLCSIIPPAMTQDQIEWVLLYNHTPRTYKVSTSSSMPSRLQFPIRFTWLVEELIYLEKIIDYLTKEETEGRLVDKDLLKYFHILLKHNKESNDIRKTCGYMVKPKTSYDKLGCIGIIIHPSLPNEEVVCIGYNWRCWMLQTKINIFNSMVLKNDNRILEKHGIEKLFFHFLESSNNN